MFPLRKPHCTPAHFSWFNRISSNRRTTIIHSFSLTFSSILFLFTSQIENHTSLNENYVVPCICLRAIWHMHGSMWRATRMTRDRKRIIVAHCVIALWRHYYYALAKFYCRGRVEGNFSGHPSHKTYTCQYVIFSDKCHFLLPAAFWTHVGGGPLKGYGLTQCFSNFFDRGPLLVSKNYQ